MTSPASVPLHLLALEQAAQPGTFTDLAVGGDASSRVTSDAQLRAAIVNVAGYYLRLAKTRTPAQMEALIWDNTSSNGADHGESCAAFASLTLELAAQAVGQQSWVTGGDTYPWPMPEWADVRVDTNPASPQITSLVADAQGHGRWRPLGDGYQPQPGDWAVYDGHVEVVTRYAGGVLDTIGADSLPGLTVNAHSSAAPLADQGVAGFVDNGNLRQAGAATAPAAPASSPDRPAETQPAATQPAKGKAGTGQASPARPAAAAVPGVLAGGDLLGGAAAGTARAPGPGASSAASIPGLAGAGAGATTGQAATAGSAVVPGAVPTASAAPATTAPTGPATAPTAPPAASHPSAAPSAQPTPAGSPSTGSTNTGSSNTGSSSTGGQRYTTPGTRDQQAFISLVAPGAVAAQQRFGVPAAVTIAQAIEESAWGRSGLAARYHNLFGIKGTGPAGSVSLPTSEYQGGAWVTIDAQFRVYHNDAESIADHAELLASSGYYTRAMADRAVPDAFANDLTGVYATDPDYGANLIALMKLYNLYQFDGAAGSATAATPAPTASPAATPAAAPTGNVAAAPTATPSARATARGTAGTTAGATAGAPSGRAGTGAASVPGVATPSLAPSAPAATPPASASPSASASRRGAAQVPGVVTSSGIVTTGLVTTGRVTRPAAKGPARYRAELPHAVTTALFASAKAPLARGEHLYRDVAGCTGVSWELLAAADWMQCKSDPRYSPVHGEKVGSLNDDGTSYPTKSAALVQCACDLVELSAAVYGIDLTAGRRLSVRELAAAFAAFRWGAILRRQGVSPMEFPYSVAGLTAQHQKMHWPPVDAPDAPDRPGARFRAPFGAVPVVLSLDYPATV
jgi:flagellum-specific peptidoglycan hydrolase FlgJ